MAEKLSVAEQAVAICAGALPKFRERFIIVQDPPNSPNRVFMWNGKVWEKITLEQFRAAVDSYLYENGQLRSPAILNEVHWRLVSRLITTRYPFDRRPDIINLQDGVLDLRTGKLHKHDPKFLCAKIASASWNGPTTGIWERFIADAVPDANVRRELRRAFGLALWGGNPQQTFYVLQGTGGSRKSATVLALNEVLGDYSQGVSKTAFEDGYKHPTELAQFENLRMAYTEETPKGPLDDTTIKMLSGSSWITARKSRQDNRTFEATATVFLIANKPLEISFDDSGTLRRIRVIPFRKRLPLDKRDPFYLEKLAKDKTSILRWAWEGLRDYLCNPHWQSEVVTRLVSELASQQDPLFEFIEQWVVLDHDAWTPTNLLFKAYLAWCETRGMQPAIKSENSFSRALTQRGLEPSTRRYRGERARGRVGIRLKKEALGAIGEPVVTPVAGSARQNEEAGK